MGYLPPPPHPSIAPPHYLDGKSLSIEGSPSSPLSTSVSPCPFALSLSPCCCYQPSSLLPHSSHWGVSTHLPSCGATPLPSISYWSPLGRETGILLTFSLNCLPHSATFYLLHLSSLLRTNLQFNKFMVYSHKFLLINIESFQLWKFPEFCNPTYTYSTLLCTLQAILHSPCPEVLPKWRQTQITWKDQKF